jgi:hypothetical protein
MSETNVNNVACCNMNSGMVRDRKRYLLQLKAIVTEASIIKDE